MNSNIKSAHALVIFRGKILFLHRDNNLEINDPNFWSLIGGVKEEGESLEETLIREAKEETNIEISEPNFLMPKSTGNGNYYYVFLTQELVDNMRLGDEGQELKFFDLDEIEKLQLSGVASRILFREHSDKISKLLQQSLEF